LWYRLVHLAPMDSLWYRLVHLAPMDSLWYHLVHLAPTDSLWYRPVHLAPTDSLWYRPVYLAPTDTATVKLEHESDTLSQKIKEGMLDGIGYLLDNSGLSGITLKLVLLGSLIYQIIHQRHDSQYAAHARVRKTRRWIMHRDVGRNLMFC
jgi:hypothetical protein